MAPYEVYRAPSPENIYQASQSAGNHRWDHVRGPAVRYPGRACVLRARNIGCLNLNDADCDDGDLCSYVDTDQFTSSASTTLSPRRCNCRRAVIINPDDTPGFCSSPDLRAFTTPLTGGRDRSKSRARPPTGPWKSLQDFQGSHRANGWTLTPDVRKSKLASGPRGHECENPGVMTLKSHTRRSRAKKSGWFVGWRFQPDRLRLALEIAFLLIGREDRQGSTRVNPQLLADPLKFRGRRTQIPTGEAKRDRIGRRRFRQK